MLLEPTAGVRREEFPAARYVAPFALFLLFLAIGPRLPLDPRLEAPARVLLLTTACAICWPREISLWPTHWMASIGVGAGVFVLWIAPDLLIPGYRDLPLFSNAITGSAHASAQAASLHTPWMLAWRMARAVVVVPVVEELFWRGWLMRWLIHPDFRRVPLGTYAPVSFWVTAILFASEHGPYWDVGLLAGMVYNLWMIRTRSLADCVLMHAVTNALLSAYVIANAQWQYWQ